MGYALRPRKKWTKDNSSLGGGNRHRPPACAGSIALLLHPLLDRVLDVLDLVALDVEQPAADFLDTADIDRLADVASLRIDRDRTARAFPFHRLGGRDARLGA